MPTSPSRPAKKGGSVTNPKKLLRVDPSGPKVKFVPVKLKPKAAKVKVKPWKPHPEKIDGQVGMRT